MARLAGCRRHERGADRFPASGISCTLIRHRGPAKRDEPLGGNPLRTILNGIEANKGEKVDMRKI